MIKYLSYPFCLFLLLVGLPSCDKYKELPLSKTAVFKSNPEEKLVKPIIQEASGMADSKLNAGNLWVHEDSGKPTQLYALVHDGKVVKKIFLKGLVNRDWEDMALAGTDLFIGDIGDNNQVYPEYAFYQFPEPTLTTDTVKNSQMIRFRYPDGSHDAEAFLVDPQTKDILIITKQDDPSRIYRLAYPFNYAGINAVTLVGKLKYSGIVSAALSPDGAEILLKTYTSLYYYARTGNESMADALQKDFTNIPYVLEPQGEAITFAADNSGFYTLSEKGLAKTVNLNFYKRK